MVESRTGPVSVGYDEGFMNPLDDDFTCLICQVALREPVLTRCGHRFCRGCLEQCFSRQNGQCYPNPCPVDREKLVYEKDVIPDKATERKILSLAIKCPTEGCGWTGELREKQEHYRECEKYQVECPHGCGAKMQREKPSKKPKVDEVQELLTLYQPPDWLICTVNRISPYVPQIGDEVYYFRQGHELYVKEVMVSKCYEINPKKQCYYKLRLKGEELCRIASLHYSTGPPTLCCLKLALINPETGNNTGASFTVKYHDVPDFLVLRQAYDISINRKWRPGHRFRSVVDETWWAGEITDRSPFQTEFPDSHFQCFTVRWDTGEVERMSPWDLQPVTEHDPGNPDLSAQDTDASGAATSNIPLTDEEGLTLAYVPDEESEWLGEGREEMTQRLVTGLEALSQLHFAGPFVYPVDVHEYPDYWCVVPYPTDLNTLREKLLNKYYRRVTALLWEVKQLERNARLYNKEESQIVRNSSKLVSVLNVFIRDSSCNDILSLFEDEEGIENGNVQLSHHTGGECPHAQVQCPYQPMGCNVMVQREQLESHLDSSARRHLDLACVKLNASQEQFKETTRKLESKTEAFEKQCKEKFQGFELQMQLTGNLGTKRDNEILKLKEESQPFVWKIECFRQMLKAAKRGRDTIISSGKFFTGPNGYKLALDMYPNGIGGGKNTHISVYLTIVRGKYDAVLPWPFRKTVTFTLIDQEKNLMHKKNYVMTLGNERTSDAFARPVTDFNIGYGFPTFISHQELRRRSFIEDDTLFLQVQTGPPS